MTKEDAKKTLKENLCAMCSYGYQNMDSCDIKSCDSKDAIKTLEQEPCEDSVSRKAVLNLAKDLDFSGVKGLEHYKHRCIEIEDVEQLPPVTPDLSSLREINKALTERVKYLEDMEKYATPKTFQKIGKWVKYCMPRCGEQHFICTNCGKYVAYLEHHIKDLKYCPNCGSRNEVE